MNDLLDMDYKSFSRVRSVENIYTTIKKLRAYTDERIHGLTDGERRLIKYLLDIGMELLN